MAPHIFFDATVEIGDDVLNALNYSGILQSKQVLGDLDVFSNVLELGHYEHETSKLLGVGRARVVRENQSLGVRYFHVLPSHPVKQINALCLALLFLHPELRVAVEDGLDQGAQDDDQRELKGQLCQAAASLTPTTRLIVAEAARMLATDARAESRP